MNMLTYLLESARTAATVLHPEKVAPGYVRHYLEMFTICAGKLDTVKKCLFYNRDTLLETNKAPGYEPASIDDVPIDLLHGILGVLTEAGEMAELLQDAVANGTPIPRGQLLDESGDLMWYLAMIFRHEGTTFEEVGGRNIDKLRIRFPDKFTLKDVNNKDHVAESKVFEEMTPVIQRGDQDV